MCAANSQVKTKQVLKSATGEATQLLAAVFNNLKDVLKAPATGETPRLLFPNGIEIIYVKIDMSNWSVEVEIAGEKGHRTLKAESTAKVSALAE